MQVEIKNDHLPNIAPLTNKELWNIPEKEVHTEVIRVIPDIAGKVTKWLEDRPTMLQSSRAALFLPLTTEAILNREHEVLSLASRETRELLRGVIIGSCEEDLKMELGDCAFSLAASEVNNSLLINPEHTHTIFEMARNEIIQENPELFSNQNFSAEVSLVNAADILEKSVAVTFDQNQLVYDNVSLNKADQTIGGPIEKGLAFNYEIVTRYALARGWDLEEIIDNVVDKNNRNYPFEFFDERSPFRDYREGIACIRLFREYVFTNESSIETLRNDLNQNVLWMFHSDELIFHDWVISQLESINENQSAPHDHQITAALLQDIALKTKDTYPYK